jgi:undecaprenyl-diphosphatase
MKRSLSLRLTFAFLLSLIFAAGFGVVAALVGFHRISAFDQAIIDFWQGRESKGLTALMKFFTNIGSGWPVILIALACMLYLYVVLKHRRELILFLFVLGGSEVLNVVAKALFHRERPEFHRLIQETGYSFPSGHSMGAFSLYGVLAYLLWKHIPTWWGRLVLVLASGTLILAIGISRIYLGVHYPSDVLGGYLASAFWLAASIWIYQSFREYGIQKDTAQREKSGLS